ncbi:hypothetical protein LCGC14_2808520, partial [marine sediment metagenome]
MKMSLKFKNIEISEYTNLFVATLFSMMLWGLMWDKPGFILFPIIWTIPLIIAYYMAIRIIITKESTME